MIWTHSGQHDLLRLSAVLEMVDNLSQIDFDELISTPLHQVEVWHRGSRPIISKADPSCLVEVTIDSRGISHIERLRRPAGRPRSHYFVYTIIKAKQNVAVDFQFGLGRIASIGQTKLQITDAPKLAELTCFRFPSRAPGIRLATVDLASCWGITFFMTQSSTLAIHAHTQATPFAETTFGRLPPSTQAFVRWVYVPNPSADKISAFGVQLKVNSLGQPLVNNCTYLIRTPHRGDFHVGTHHDGTVKSFAVRMSNGSALVYTVSEQKPVSVLGVVPKGQECSDLSPSPSIGPALIADGCFASAVLKDVACIWVFRDGQTDFYRGLIIHYHGGSQQALGCCRLGVDPVERCADLARFAFALSELPRENAPPFRVVKVKVSPTPLTGSCLDEGWTRCPEGHILQVWATAMEVAMNIIPAI
ncbi:hypothetical protein CSHISOI_08049 [Colletotrichum shisoi]|uniref:Uncharacterized protein n=1 Tax=Colletotrichum shisoi TaxID=2078593 RepID=A0A5Q4BL22_9PEZI|nr:hypothetical protein CSHISOI_08049 [Colletotrichum shisoi]